jgi:hypothetical protein
MPARNQRWPFLFSAVVPSLILARSWSAAVQAHAGDDTCYSNTWLQPLNFWCPRFRQHPGPH